MQDGVYLGLPHADYLAVPGRLGSTDMTKLYARGAGWWWTSAHNPYYVPKATEAQTFGTALHTLLLEGPAAYAERFAVMPNPRDYPGLLRSADDLRSALEAAEAPGLKAKTSKNDLVQLAKAYLPDVPVWDDIVERWTRTARDRQHLASDEAFAIDAMYEAAMADPDMAEVCNAHGGVKLVEVSVLWTCAKGLKKRYRFDSLLPTANVDLKSLMDWRARSLEDSVASRIRDEHLAVQLAMSHEARLAAYQLIEAGLVFWDVNVSPIEGKQRTEELQWLKRFPAEAPLAGKGGPGWCWLWMFYRKPEGGSAPALLPLRVMWGDDLHVSGWRKLRIAEQTYLENVARFGLENRWTEVRPLHDTSHAAARRVEVKEWDVPMQQPGEREAMKWQR